MYNKEQTDLCDTLSLVQTKSLFASMLNAKEQRRLAQWPASTKTKSGQYGRIAAGEEGLVDESAYAQPKEVLEIESDTGEYTCAFIFLAVVAVLATLTGLVTSYILSLDRGASPPPPSPPSPPSPPLQFSPPPLSPPTTVSTTLSSVVEATQEFEAPVCYEQGTNKKRTLVTRCELLLETDTCESSMELAYLSYDTDVNSDRYRMCTTDRSKALLHDENLELQYHDRPDGSIQCYRSVQSVEMNSAWITNSDGCVAHWKYNSPDYVTARLPCDQFYMEGSPSYIAFVIMLSSVLTRASNQEVHIKTCSSLGDQIATDTTLSIDDAASFCVSSFEVIDGVVARCNYDPTDKKCISSPNPLRDTCYDKLAYDQQIRTEVQPPEGQFYETCHAVDLSTAHNDEERSRICDKHYQYSHLCVYIGEKRFDDQLTPVCSASNMLVAPQFSFTNDIQPTMLSTLFAHKKAAGPRKRIIA